MDSSDLSSLVDRNAALERELVINMPGMSGLELLEKVKNEFPEIKESMISAYGDSENYERAMNSGAREFFTKPIDFETLKTEMHEILNGTK